MKFTWRSGSSARAPSQHAPARGEILRQDTELNFDGISPPQKEDVLDTLIQCLILLLESHLSVWVAHDEGLLLPCLLLALADNLALFVVDIFKASRDVLKLR